MTNVSQLSDGAMILIPLQKYQAFLEEHEKLKKQIQASANPEKVFKEGAREFLVQVSHVVRRFPYARPDQIADLLLTESEGVAQCIWNDRGVPK